MFSLFAKSRRIRVRQVSPAYLVFMWFGSFVMLGTVLLWLPWSRVQGSEPVDFVGALFTAVSAACVTGLSVVNVADSFSLFGQFVIWILMEMGGLGIMTFAHVGFRLFGRRLSMSQQSATADALFQSDAAREFKTTFKRIVRVMVLVQAVGMVVMAVALVPHHWHEEGGGWLLTWSAAFHSVSAFCNSGFTIYRDSLDSLQDNYLFLVCLLVLVTLGGLGHKVLVELYHLPRFIRRHERRPHWISLHTRVVLVVTAAIIVFGVASFWLLGTGPSGSRNLWQAVFETVSGRTAGFSVMSQAALPLPSIIVIVFLMFVGGSPGSCAGGIKTTSLAIWIARIKANLRNDTSVNLFGFAIAQDLVSRARILMALTMMWNVAGVFILSVCHPEESLQTLVFEQISAFGTVGLSMEFTPKLVWASRLWVVLSMFVGRLGPLSIALWMIPASKAKITRPISRIMVG